MPPKKDPKSKGNAEANAKDDKGKTPSKNSKAAGKGEGAGGGGDASAGGDGKLKPAMSVNVRHILCSKHSTRAEALTKLNAGASFADIAREYSEDKARQGGSLGWKNRGQLLKEFEDVAFGLGVSSSLVGGKGLVVGECKTGEGYHLVCVEGRR